MNSHQIENLLRRPVEWWSTAFCVSTALFIILNKHRLALQVDSTFLLVTFFLSLGSYRFWQGWQINRYQRYLKRLPFYALSSNELPIKSDQLFLGKGFKWQAAHTQRLNNLKQQGGDAYLKPGLLTRLARYLNLSKSTLPVGGNSAIHGVEPNEQTVFLNQSERVGHTMILGTTRVGKTRLLELMIASDIRRNDSAVVVFDPKGDIELLKRLCFEAKAAGRASVIVFHLGYPSVSARYNPIGHFARVTEVANRIANQLPSSGESAAFREFAWRFVNIIANALVALGKKPNYKAMDKYILNIDPLLLEYCEQWLPRIDPEWRKKVEKRTHEVDDKKLPFHLKARNKFMIALVDYVDSLDCDNAIYSGLKAIFNYDQTYFQKITASLSPLFSKLTTGRIAELISPDYANLDDTRLLFDWLQVIRGKKIVYIGLDALSDSTVSSAVGNSMFADLCSTIGQIYKFGVEEDISSMQHKKTFHKTNVYSDEFNELAGDEFIPLANKGGGAGLQLTVATQTGSDVLARLGSQAKANQVFGNFNSLICLRVLETSTARLLTDKLPQKVSIKSVLHSSSAQDSATLSQGQHFSSHTEDRITTQEVPLISNEDLMQLPKGQAFCLLDGGQLYKVRFPLPKNDMNHMPERVEDLVDDLYNT